MTSYVFPPPPVMAVPVQGTDALFPLRRIFCVGRNYEAHAREMGAVIDREAPFYFNKASIHVVPSGATVAYPTCTANYHYEMELVVALGAQAFEVPAAEALAAVFGYACGLDMTRRDLQAISKVKGQPWDTGKDFEQSAVLSAIRPAADIGHPAAGVIALEVNGESRQSSDLSLMIHPVPAIIADLSKFYHLEPGDLIYTGTPEGVGPVRSGDRITGRIAGVGEIALVIA